MFSIFNEEFASIERESSAAKSPNVPWVFRRFPLDEFERLLLDVPSEYPHLKAYFPSMASAEIQKHWTGSHGEALLSLS